MDAISEAVKRASELASKISPSDIPLPPAKKQVTETKSLSQTLTQRLQDINALSFPFTDISLVQPGYGQVLERYKIPESILTYVIGRNCEQINRIQRESNCRIYIESGPREGSTNVIAALVGSENNVKKAMGSMDITVAKGKIFSAGNLLGPSIGDQDSENVEMLIPGPLAGLIIGKNGETIKHMQISTGAKMIMIQESCSSTIYDKPLRISGEAEQVQAAVKLVNEILNSKEAEARKFGQDGQPTEFFKMQILNEKVGIVIGRGGETIREINEESGALVEVSKAAPPNSYEQDFNIWGTRDQIITAVQMICARTQTELPPFVADQVERINNEHYYNSTLGIYTTAAAWRQNAASNPENAHGYCIDLAQYQQLDDQTATQSYASVQQAPQIDPLTGQPDYTLAWVEYFRNLGDIEKAHELLAQQAARQQQATLKMNQDKAKSENAENNDAPKEDKKDDDLEDIKMPENDN